MENSAKTQKSKFDILYEVDCSAMIEKKDTGSAKLSYLSWANAWAQFKHICPDANYEVIKFDGLPYICDPLIGIMVFTTVTANGETIGMQLPVMDGTNKAMKLEPYTYTVKTKTGFIEKSVKAADMFDINKTIMRCLTKNLGMFGLGLSIYAGEDIPQPLSADEEEALAEDIKSKKKKKATTRKAPVMETKEASVDLRTAVLTTEMFKGGQLNKIVDYLVGKYDNDIADIPEPSIEVVRKSYHWADDKVANDVVAAARRKAFSNDINEN